MTAPNFCMLLRKHIQNGRIVDISQPSLERILEFTIEHLDELGDVNVGFRRTAENSVCEYCDFRNICGR